MAEKYPINHTVLEDMDGVLFDFEGAVDAALALEFPNLERADPRSHFYVYARYEAQNPEVADFIKSTQNSQGFFRSLDPLPGAIDQWRALIEAGYTPRICSAPLTDNPHCITEKLEMIDYYFGPHAADAAFIGKNKQDEDGICLIDDRPAIKDGRYWQRVAYTQPYNTHESDCLRIDGWNDPTLLQILAICAERYDKLMSSGN